MGYDIDRMWLNIGCLGLQDDHYGILIGLASSWYARLGYGYDVDGIIMKYLGIYNMIWLNTLGLSLWNCHHWDYVSP